MFRSVLLVFLVTCILHVHAISQIVEYHMGGSLTNAVATKFTFERSINTTTVTWQQFGAEADGNGMISNIAGETYPSGYGFSNLYRGFYPMGLTRWTYVYQNKVATVQIRNTDPLITVAPTDANAFTPGQIVTVRSGSIVFLNTDVNLGGQPQTIGGLLSTLDTTAATATTTTATTTAKVSTTSAGSKGPSSTATALEISLPLTFAFLLMAGLSI